MQKASHCSVTSSRLVTSPLLDQTDVPGKITGNVRIRHVKLTYTYCAYYLTVTKKGGQLPFSDQFKWKNICVKLYSLLFCNSTFLSPVPYSRSLLAISNTVCVHLNPELTIPPPYSSPKVTVSSLSKPVSLFLFCD